MVIHERKTTILPAEGQTDCICRFGHESWRLESGESRSGNTQDTALDDIDDYSGLDNQPPQTAAGGPMDGTNGAPNFSDYRRLTEVACVVVDSGNNRIRDAAGGEIPTEYKRITVTVRHPAIPDFTITSVRAEGI